jgi:hypothetical protein
MQESNPVGGAEAPPTDHAQGSVPTATGDALADPRALQILSTEHWSLLATRSLAYNEAFSRAGMFLTFLSASLIVIGFVIGAQGLTGTVVPVALALLLADLFLGLATVGRILAASAEELQCVRGMNRIRHAYREMVPGLEPYFITSFHDDARGVLAAYGGGIQTKSGPVIEILHGLTTTPGMIATIDAMIVGAMGALIALGLGAGLGVALVLAVVGFVAAFAVFLVVGMRIAVPSQERAESRFPTPDRTPR